MKYLCIISFLIITGCAHRSNFEWQAQDTCSKLGYGYDADAYRQCVDYALFVRSAVSKGESYPTQAEFVCDKEDCAAESEERASCLKKNNKLLAESDKKAKKYAAEIKRQQIENEKRIERERKEAIARQKAADASQCREYGFAKGTGKFAECMMKIEQGRIDEAHRQEMMTQQAAIANQQRQQAANAALLNYLGQAQQTQAINNLAFQQQMQNMQPVRLQTSCTRFGNTVNCY